MAAQPQDKPLQQDAARDLAVGPRSKDVPWYEASPTQIPSAARRLLETYSHIPAEDVTAHVIAVRERAWEVCPYPCIGGFRFLDLSMAQTAEYPEILARLKEGETLLDMACCFGQEVRKLVADGAPAGNVWGSDLMGEFVELGYDLFLDRETLGSRFVVGDVFDQGSDLGQLRGKMDMVYAGSFFHLFGWEGQVQASKEVVRLLKPKKGSMIVGRQVGSTNPSVKEHKTNPTGEMYRHNVESLQKQWREIGEAMGVRFTVTGYLTELEGSHRKFHDPDDTKRIWFKVVREE